MTIYISSRTGVVTVVIAVLATAIKLLKCKVRHYG